MILSLSKTFLNYKFVPSRTSMANLSTYCKKGIQSTMHQSPWSNKSNKQLSFDSHHHLLVSRFRLSRYSTSNHQDLSNKKAPKSEYTKEDYQRLTLKSVSAIFISGAALYVYFQYEKSQAKQRQEESKDQSAGKPLVGGPFHLVDHNGIPVSDKDFLGKYMLVYFGYTYCPDVCPEELEKMAKIANYLESSNLKTPVVPIFISVDPKRDSIASIKEYIREFSDKFVGLTGTHQQIRKVARAYRMYYSAPPKAVDDDESDYLVDHSIFFFLIGPNGEYLAHFGRQETAESVSEKILAIDASIQNEK